MADIWATLVGGGIGFTSGFGLSWWNASRAELKEAVQAFSKAISEAADVGSKCWLSDVGPDRLYLEAKTLGLQELILGSLPSVTDRLGSTQDSRLQNAVLGLINELTGYNFYQASRLADPLRAAAVQVEGSKTIVISQNILRRRLTLAGCIEARLDG